MHVDYEPHLKHFYQRCGFRSTLAGLIDLQAEETKARRDLSDSLPAL